MSQLYIQTKHLVPLIKKLIKLGHELKQARHKFEQSIPTPSDVISSFENWEKYHNDPDIQKSQEAMRTVLNSISYDEACIVIAVMYVGRDEYDPEELIYAEQSEDYDELIEEAEHNGVFDSPQKKIFDYLKAVKHGNESKEILLNVLNDKSAFPEYLERGIKILRLVS